MDKFKNFLSKFNIFRKSSKKGKSDSSPADYDQFEDSKIDVEIPDQLKKKGGDKLKSFGKKFTATMKARMAKASANTTAGPGINWNNIYQTVFSPQSRPFIHKSFLVLFFCGSTYFMGRLVALMIAPQTSIKKSAPNRTLNPGGNELRQQLAAIKNNDLFDAVGDAQTQVADKPKVDENLVCLEAKQKSSLPINLVSTIVLQDTVKSVASVQVRGQKTLEYLREGEKVGNLAQIGSIVDKKLIFKNLSSGQCEYVAAKEVREKQLAPIAVERNPQKGRKIISRQTDWHS